MHRAGSSKRIEGQRRTGRHQPQPIRQAGVFTLDLLGAPAAAKPPSSRRLCKSSSRLRAGVIVGDLTTQRDADRMARSPITSSRSTPARVATSRPITSWKPCPESTSPPRHPLHRRRQQPDLPRRFDLGQHVKVGMFCTTGGDDNRQASLYRAGKHHLLLLNKIYLLQHAPFYLQLFRMTFAC